MHYTIAFVGTLWVSLTAAGFGWESSFLAAVLACFFILLMVKLEAKIK